jgi:hypothetical protein
LAGPLGAVLMHKPKARGKKVEPGAI